MRLIKRLILNSSPFSIILNIHTNILQLLLFKNKQKKLLWPHVPLISFLSLLYVTFIENSLYLLILIPGCSPTLPSHFFFCCCCWHILQLFSPPPLNQNCSCQVTNVYYLQIFQSIHNDDFPWPLNNTWYPWSLSPWNTLLIWLQDASLSVLRLRTILFFRIFSWFFYTFPTSKHWSISMLGP